MILLVILDAGHLVLGYAIQHVQELVEQHVLVDVVMHVLVVLMLVLVVLVLALMFALAVLVVVLDVDQDVLVLAKKLVQELVTVLALVPAQ